TVSDVTPWETIAAVQQERVALLNRSGSLRSGLYSIAEELVLMATEDTRPSEERLREYRDSNRQSLEQRLFSPAPLYEDLERVQLADELARFTETRGGSDELVQQVLDGKGPRERAAELVASTKLFSVQARRELAKSGQAGIA